MKNFIQSIKDFFSNLFKRFQKAPAATVVDPTPVGGPAPVVTPSQPVLVVATPPVTIPDLPPTADDAGRFGYAPRQGDKPREVAPTNPTNEVRPEERDPTKSWFGTEFKGPGSITSVEFEAKGKYEVVVGYDVDRGKITAFVNGYGSIHQEDVINLDGKYTVTITATGPGGSSVQLYKRD